MQHLTCVVIAMALAAALVPAGAQTPSNGPDSPLPGTPNPWSVGPIEIHALIDVYYSLNLNHPKSRTNQLRNFDVKANQFSLNLAKLVMEQDAAPVGFRFDLGFGRALELVHAAEGAPGALRHIEQAYFSYKPTRIRGLQFDVGKYVTSAGAEVIETDSNWNYSRSLLFAWAIPYYHFGVRAAMPLYRNFTAGLQVTNGWNNVKDNNSGKTVGLTATYALEGLSWTQTYYVGPEKADIDQGYRHLYDTTLLVTPRPQIGFYVNFDYGLDKKGGPGTDRWVGIAGAARFSPVGWLALSPRVEWFNDADGFSTGTAQQLKEVTLTAEFRMAEGVRTRVEYRTDWSDQPFFDRGPVPGLAKRQTTLLVGWLACFGRKR